uniref:Uncharacterized protein n=1 Tax=Siphoviridae sp. ctcK97 TaxID=2825571 RepID=A0A8S5UAT9_9CAUD|nr:MAG TPA: hypothetical protein [Siphoviridae sp. ctcK97]
MGSPARQKRLGLSFFSPVLSGYTGLMGLTFLSKNVKWVCFSEWVCVLGGEIA